jgi:hypothetical protein
MKEKHIMLGKQLLDSCGVLINVFVVTSCVVLLTKASFEGQFLVPACNKMC